LTATKQPQAMQRIRQSSWQFRHTACRSSRLYLGSFWHPEVKKYHHALAADLIMVGIDGYDLFMNNLQ